MQAVMAHVERLIEAGLPAEAIGVITPYNGQVAALRELRADQLSGVEISSVDGFQGECLQCAQQQHSLLSLCLRFSGQSQVHTAHLAQGL